MGIIEGLVVGGATATIITGTAALAVLGGWGRRAPSLVAAAVAGLWWLNAWMGAGLSGALCADCPPTFDPWAYAYSAPLLALEMLIAPAAVVALLALGPWTAGWAITSPLRRPAEACGASCPGGTRAGSRPA